jgi:DNA polymerase elongation subunit (family B)
MDGSQEDNQIQEKTSDEAFVFRLIDFNVQDVIDEEEDEYEIITENELCTTNEPFNACRDGENDGSFEIRKNNKRFTVQVFGLDAQCNKYVGYIHNFRPYFYLKVIGKYSDNLLNRFRNIVEKRLGKFSNKNSVTEIKHVKKKTLYGFDAGRKYHFIKISFSNLYAYYKTRSMWYVNVKDATGKQVMEMMNGEKRNKRQLSTYHVNGFGVQLQLYEGNIPPLLRFFHINDISPSGWVQCPHDACDIIDDFDKETTCDFEFHIDYCDLEALPNKETSVPYTICSFDIEASSSHGDFPMAIKDYTKLAVGIVDTWNNVCGGNKGTLADKRRHLIQCIKGAFGIIETPTGIELVYPKKCINAQIINGYILRLLNKKLMEKKDAMRNKTEYTEKDAPSAANTEDKHGRKKVTFKDLGFKVKQPTGKRRTVVSVNTEDIPKIIKLLDNTKLKRDEMIVAVNNELVAEHFPSLEGDRVTFIGSTFVKYGEKEPYLNHCITLNTCDDMNADEVPNSEIVSYNSEREVLLAWKDIIQRENPDIIIGYNIFGFDYRFMIDRANELNCAGEFLDLSKVKNHTCGSFSVRTGKYELTTKKTVVASGEYDLTYAEIPGRLQIDLFGYFRKQYNLESYKLDNVAAEFIGDGIKKTVVDNGRGNGSESGNGCTRYTTIYSSNLIGLHNGSFVRFEELSHTTKVCKNGKKFVVYDVNRDEGTFRVKTDIRMKDKVKLRWCLVKDDVTPQDIFRLTGMGASERSIVAKYCIQDCNLVHYLLRKIDVITGLIEMANISSVPVNFLVMRGQSIKLTSLLSKECRTYNTLIPVIPKSENDQGYEGAIVLKPKCDLYLEDPVACVDYSSLYPSSIISENLSHDTKVWTKEYDLSGNLVGETGSKNSKGVYIYDNLPNYQYLNVTFDTFRYRRKSPKAAPIKEICGKKVCRYARAKSGEMGLIPRVLTKLLKARKDVRALIKTEPDPFKQRIYEKRQLACKLSANSLYGGMGASVSIFYEPDIAASTTAVGRMLLLYAKTVIEDVYGDTICKTSTHGDLRSRAEYIYGDTDSVFFTFHFEDMNGRKILGEEALEPTIEVAQEVGKTCSMFLKGPHDLEYEKTFLPFCLLSKKRYVGMLYELDPHKCKRKSMGIVLKRRDNAPIVKDVYGGIIDILMKDQNIDKSIKFLQNCLQRLANGNYPMDKLIITKSLRSGYKNPKQIAHKVLADRIGDRDPGNKPRSGDRIPYVYIVNNTRGALQGDKIESPQYIIDNSLEINYKHYITNQIMKPVQQIYSLVLEEIPTFKRKKQRFICKMNTMRNSASAEGTVDKFENTEQKMRNTEVKQLLFDKYLYNNTGGNLFNMMRAN